MAAVARFAPRSPHGRFHEFRTDLQVVQNAVVFWNEGDFVSDSLKKAARSSILHCKSLMENVLDIGKFKSGTLELAAEDFALHEPVERYR